MVNANVISSFLKPAMELGILTKEDIDLATQAIREKNKIPYNPNELVKLDKVKQITQLTKPGIYNLIRSGKLKRQKIGGATRFYLRDIYALVEEK